MVVMTSMLGFVLVMMIMLRRHGLLRLRPLVARAAVQHGRTGQALHGQRHGHEPNQQ